jgi:hypothetical protein
VPIIPEVNVMDFLNPQPGDVDDADLQGQNIPEEREQPEDNQSLHELNDMLNAGNPSRGPS